MKMLLLIATVMVLSSCGKTKTNVETRIVEKELPDSRMTCQVFDLLLVPGTPNFKLLESIGNVKVSQLDDSQSNTNIPFSPFIDSEFESMTENIGITCSGTLVAEVSGNHNLYINSDDGSTLSLNGVKLIDNNGSHTMVKKGITIMLLAGSYKINITYYNRGGPKGLVLSIKRPNRSKEEVLKF